MMQGRLSNAEAFDLGFPKTNYDIMCVIWTEGTCSPTQDCRLAIPPWTQHSHFAYSLLSNLPFVSQFLHSPVPSPTLSLFLPFLFSPCSSLSSFLSSLFPLLSRIYNVPCLDFNGMCSRETPVVIHNPVPWKFSEEMPRQLSFMMQHYLLNLLDSCTHSETNMAKKDKKTPTFW